MVVVIVVVVVVVLSISIIAVAVLAVAAVNTSSSSCSNSSTGCSRSGSSSRSGPNKVQAAKLLKLGGFAFHIPSSSRRHHMSSSCNYEETLSGPNISHPKRAAGRSRNL